MGNPRVFVLTLRRRSDSLKRHESASNDVEIGPCGHRPRRGDRGLLAWVQRAHQVHAAETQLAATEDELARLRHRSELLKGNHLDADLLDERTRAALNSIGPDEIVIFIPPEKPLN